MANDNETVAQLCENTINYKLNKHQSKMKFSGVQLHECEVELCTKILAAYKRELEEMENLKRHLREAVASQCSCKFKCYWYDSENNKCNRNDPNNPCCVWPSRVALGEGVVNGK